MSQTTLGRGLGLSSTFVGMMERGDRPVEPRTAFALRYLFEHPEVRPDPDDDDEAWKMAGVYNVGELMKVFEDSRRLQDGRRWGRWRFSGDSLSLDLDSEEHTFEREGEMVTERRERYYVLLCELTSTKLVLDWIGQISRKGWGSPAIGDFVTALEDIFGLQSTFVYGKGFGSPDEIEQYLRSRLNER